jgi:hypothetical protein
MANSANSTTAIELFLQIMAHGLNQQFHSRLFSDLNGKAARAAARITPCSHTSPCYQNSNLFGQDQ